MNKKLLIFVTISCFVLSQNIWAQEKSVSGTVTVSDSGMPLLGVNVIEKGTQNGTSTDFDGKYSIEVSKGSTLVFSIVGFASKEVIVKDQKTINVQLSESTESLDKVVVTALGIKRKEKALSYAQQKIGSDEISKTHEPNFVNSLAGKTSGVQLQESAAGAGGSSRIILRGNKSIFGSSQPLFVIDGVPMTNNSQGETGSIFSSRDEGDGLSQINPDDIESISILKGANAAALYGSQGANGVILITTKSGSAGKLKGSVSSGILFKSVYDIPDMQYRYGAKDEKSVESWSTEKENYNDTFLKDFFNTGFQLTNSLSLSGGSENSTSYLSYANTTTDGVIPENNYTRNNVTFKHSNNFFNKKLKVTSRIMLSDEKTRNRPSTGYYFNPLTGLYLFPRSKNFKDYKDYEVFNEDRNLNLQNWFVDSDKQQNPYWIIHNNQTINHKKRMIANIAVSYTFNEKMNLQVRGNYDYSNQTFEQKIKAGTSSTLAQRNGKYKFNDLDNLKMYTDAIFTYNDDFGDFDLDAVLGASYEKTVIGKGIDAATSAVSGLMYPNIFTLQNLTKETNIRQVVSSRKVKQGAFGNLQLGYKDMLFLDISGRNDWSSSLAFTDNTSYFYPAFGTSAILSELFELPKAISFAKLRASYSVVSTEVPAFFTNPLNSIGVDGVEINTEKPFKELKPEDQNSFEVGTNWRFFKSRLGFDLTYYRIDNKNQFIPLDAPSGSGYSVFYVNAGHIRNTGFEATINATPIKTDNLNWKSSVNFSTNKNDIIALQEELQGKYEINKSDGYALYITEGGSFGDIYTYQFLRDDQGRIKVNEKGEPQKTSEYEYIGNSQPDFLLGWNNSFNYKNWNFSFLINGRFGGKAVGGTEALLDSYGVSERSARARDRGEVIINGVGPNGKVITSVDPETYYKAIGGRDAITENYTYDATNIRLQQVSLAYNFDFDKNSFFKSASLSLISNNPFFIYKKVPFDPDIAFNPDNKFQSYNLFMTPSTSSYGVNLNLKF